MSGVWYCANQGWSLCATVLIVDSYLVYPRVIRKRQTWLREWRSPRQNRLSRPPFLWCSAIPVSALGTRQLEVKDWVLDAKEPGTSQPFLVLLSGEGWSLLTCSCGFPMRQALVSGELSFQIFPPLLSWADKSLCFLFFFWEAFFLFLFNCIGGFLERQWIA